MPTSPTSPSDSKAAEPATNNNVLLGANFGSFNGSLGSILPGGSATLQVAISNQSAQTAVVIAVTTDRPEFVPTTNCDGAVLQTGDSCIFSVTFEPLEAGTYYANLYIAVSPSSVAVPALPLEGSASPPLVDGPAAGSSPYQAAPGSNSPTPAVGTPTPSPGS